MKKGAVKFLGRPPQPEKRDDVLGMECRAEHTERERERRERKTEDKTDAAF